MSVSCSSEFPLLALDGGGVKGISSVLILDEIMDRVRTIELRNNISTSTSPRKPADYFDLAAGTSTGGLIALMLFRLRMDTRQCLEEYSTMASKIFAPTFLGSRALGSMLGSVALMANVLWYGSKFSGVPLENAITQVVEKYSQTTDPWRYNLVHPNSGMMFMCATVKEKGESILLRSYPRPQDAGPVTRAAREETLVNGIDIVSAARATSAAPTYLPEEKWETANPNRPLVFWDGGVLNNNPIEQLWNARYDLVERSKKPPMINLVLSIGCGWSENSKPSTFIRMLNIIRRFAETYLTNTEAKHRDFTRLANRMQGRGDQNNHVQYFRLNCPTGQLRFDMADYKSMPKLKDLTAEYLTTDTEAAGWVNEIAELLASRE
ncbi:hypothetical protein B0A55_09546 [Friedmanniomyces simplex]|uniref:PNPLA domain-containing protein n=1 Tax=Friedmanniomyces simplex TaxID=329884 RepID=A0A4U0WNB2_9PEZI|nr:hypothetical protein B0A55_09546 [Friedmanniomyces simplex]